MKISNVTSNSPPIKIDLFQSIKITGPDYKKEFSEIKLLSQKFESER